MKKTWIIIETLLIYLAIQIIMGSMAMIWPVSFSVLSCLANILALIAFMTLRFCKFSTSYLNEGKWQDICLFVLLGLSSLLPSMFFQEQLPELPDTVGDILASMMTSPLGFIAIALLAPIVEEVAFRGIILKSLLSTEKLSVKPWWAITISALIFAAIHMNPVQMPHAFLMGLLLGWIYYRTGSILPGVLIHFVNNTIAFILYQYYPNQNTKLVEVFGNNSNVMVSVVASVVIFIVTIYAYNQISKNKQK